MPLDLTREEVSVCRSRLRLGDSWDSCVLGVVEENRTQSPLPLRALTSDWD